MEDLAARIFNRSKAASRQSERMTRELSKVNLEAGENLSSSDQSKKQPGKGFPINQKR